MITRGASKLRDCAQWYRLLGDVFKHGVRKKNAKVLMSIPELRDRLPKPLNWDQLAADHYEAFGRNVLPLASVFCARSEADYQFCSEDFERFYAQDNFLGESSYPADHLGIAADFLADQASRSLGPQEQIFEEPIIRQWAFLQNLIVPWLPVFGAAVFSEGDPFFSMITGLFLHTVEQHSRCLLDSGMKPVKRDRLSSYIPEAEGSLEDIIQYLYFPANSGGFISIRTLNKLAKKMEIPLGFGRRDDMLTNLFRSSGHYDKSVEILQEIAALFKIQGEYFHSLHQDGWDIQECSDRNKATRALLEAMEGLASQKADFDHGA